MMNENSMGESRMSAFSGGMASGRMGNTGLNTATSIQTSPPIDPMFHPASVMGGVLGLPNFYKNVNGESASNYARTMPQEQMMRNITGNALDTP